MTVIGRDDYEKSIKEIRKQEGFADKIVVLLSDSQCIVAVWYKVVRCEVLPTVGGGAKYPKVCLRKFLSFHLACFMILNL